MAPNILVFFTDDHAQWALPCYGNSEIVAPTLDYLAATGTRMANAFTPTPVCSPARGSFWTGLYPSRHGIHDYLAEVDDHGSAIDWLAAHTTLAERLQRAGYETALAGKWHCGRGEEQHTGFDYWYSAARLTPKYHTMRHNYSDHGVVEEISGYESQWITDAAVRFLRGRDATRPFFLFVGLASTHSPWINRPERLVARYRNATFRDIPDDAPYPFGADVRHPGEPDDPREALAQYYASVTQIDEMVGRVLDELDAAGARDDTLIVYTADHGNNLGQHRLWGKGNASVPLNMLEESIRVPLIVAYPGGVVAGAVRQEMVDHTDLFMTLLDYAGALPDDAARFPGRSYRALLESADPAPDWRDAQIGEYGNVRMIRTARYKLIVRRPEGPLLFFDLEADPRETRNLYDDPAHRATIAALEARLDAFFARHADPVTSGLNVHNLPRYNPAEAWRDDLVKAQLTHS